MKSFLKIFFASFLALVVFSVICFFVTIGYITGLASKDKAKTGSKAVLVIDLNQMYPEVAVKNPFALFGSGEH